MLKPKIIAIASSDYHFHNFPNFNVDGSRLYNSLKAARYIATQCFKQKVPSLFAGDMFHSHKQIENDVIVMASDWYYSAYEKKKVDMVAIDGNHDQKDKNTLSHRSPEYLRVFKGFKTFHHLGNPLLEKPTFEVWGLPYYSYENDWLKAITSLTNEAKLYSSVPKILLLHGNAPSAKLPNGSEVESKLPRDLDKFFKYWDLVLFGHIHKPQQLSKKCYMLGSHIQQNFGDEGIEMGYWEIYSDFSMKFKSLNNIYPTFKTLKNDEQGKSKDYIIRELDSESGNLGDSIPESDIRFSQTTNKKNLSRAYCENKGINDKKKVLALTQILNEV